ncbi:UPF0175 family protein [Candidatus Hakubella thermalkaliphila]|uniref:UPF0175 family protein n=1 Tax=Candidatus Hakubella thermalkaliphila TaxID=2754717 RepID=UPI002158CB55
MEAICLLREEIPSRLKKELALRLYEKGLLSFGRARELSKTPPDAIHHDSS